MLFTELNNITKIFMRAYEFYVMSSMLNVFAQNVNRTDDITVAIVDIEKLRTCFPGAEKN